MKKRLCLFMLGLSVFGFSTMPSVLAGSPTIFTPEDTDLIRAYGNCWKKEHPDKNIDWNKLIHDGFRDSDGNTRKLSQTFSVGQLSSKYFKLKNFPQKKRACFTVEDIKKINTIRERLKKPGEKMSWSEINDMYFPGRGFTETQIKDKCNRIAKGRKPRYDVNINDEDLKMILYVMSPQNIPNNIDWQTLYNRCRDTDFKGRTQNWFSQRFNRVKEYLSGKQDNRDSLKGKLTEFLKNKKGLESFLNNFENTPRYKILSSFIKELNINTDANLEKHLNRICGCGNQKYSLVNTNYEFQSTPQNNNPKTYSSDGNQKRDNFSENSTIPDNIPDEYGNEFIFENCQDFL